MPARLNRRVEMKLSVRDRWSARPQRVNVRNVGDVKVWKLRILKFNIQ